MGGISANKFFGGSLFIFGLIMLVLNIWENIETPTTKILTILDIGFPVIFILLGIILFFIKNQNEWLVASGLIIGTASLIFWNNYTCIGGSYGASGSLCQVPIEGIRTIEGNLRAQIPFIASGLLTLIGIISFVIGKFK
ncbi:MAG: hypothetical protein AABX48_03385 [Nanoarchaeota archaeon]